MRGKLISLEGTEGAGKSTVLRYIQDYFQRAGIPIVLTREPGGTEIAEQIRQILLHSSPAEKMQPETELLLMFAGRMQNLRHSIEPALAAGQWVVSDRFIDASYAYQGGGRGLSDAMINVLDKFIVGDHYPDLTLLLDIPTQQGFARAEKRGTAKDRIEQEAIDFFDRVRQSYLQRAKQDPARIKIIDASLDIESVQSQVKHVLDQFVESQTS